MSNRDLTITILGMFLITLISIILVSFLGTKKYHEYIVIFDMSAIFIWLFFRIIMLKKNKKI